MRHLPAADGGPRQRGRGRCFHFGLGRLASSSCLGDKVILYQPYRIRIWLIYDDHRAGADVSHRAYAARYATAHGGGSMTLAPRACRSPPAPGRPTSGPPSRPGCGASGVLGVCSTVVGSDARPRPTAGPSRRTRSPARAGINPILTLDTQLLNMIGNVVLSG